MLTWRPLTETDTPAWSDLTKVLAAADDTEETYEPEDLAEELTGHGFTPVLDSWSVWDGRDLAAYGQLHVSHEPLVTGEVRASISGGVHPQWRGRGIGTELLDRIEPRAQALAHERLPGTPVLLRAPGGAEGSSAAALLADRGYAPARYFTDMRRPLPGAPLPAIDARVQSFTMDLSEQVRQAHNDSFATHWGSTPIGEQRWQDVVTARTFRPGLSRIVLAGDQVLAYVMASEWVERELYIDLVGTRQAARGQGLARAVLGAALVDAAASGEYDSADLGVDSDNPTGAGNLYASLGFAPVRTHATYTKTMAALT